MEVLEITAEELLERLQTLAEGASGSVITGVTRGLCDGLYPVMPERSILVAQASSTDDTGATCTSTVAAIVSRGRPCVSALLWVSPVAPPAVLQEASDTLAKTMATRKRRNGLYGLYGEGKAVEALAASWREEVASDPSPGDTTLLDPPKSDATILHECTRDTLIPQYWSEQHGPAVGSLQLAQLPADEDLLIGSVDRVLHC